MAYTLDGFPVVKGQTRYPWDEWLDGQVWGLVVGQDFTAKVATMKTNAQLQARKRGGRVRTRLVSEDGRQVLILQYRRG